MATIIIEQNNHFAYNTNNTYTSHICSEKALFLAFSGVFPAEKYPNAEFSMLAFCPSPGEYSSNALKTALFMPGIGKYSLSAALFIFSAGGILSAYATMLYHPEGEGMPTHGG